MGKGILLEMKGRTAVVLTPQGEFRRGRIPRGTWDVGDEIQFAEPRSVPGWARWGVAAALALVILPVGYQSWAMAQPAALMTVDINPSIELVLNRKERVLDARGLNEDGTAILDAVPWKRRPGDEVLAGITAEAINASQLDLADGSGTVVVAVAPADGRQVPQERLEEMAQHAQAVVAMTITTEGKERHVTPMVQVPALSVTAEEKEEAEEAGLTPGQYFILEEIRKTVPSVNAEELRELGPGKLLQGLGVSPGQVFQDVEKSHQSGSGLGPESGNAQDTGNGHGQGNGSSQSGGNGQGKADVPRKENNTESMPGGGRKSH